MPRHAILKSIVVYMKNLIAGMRSQRDNPGLKPLREPLEGS